MHSLWGFHGALCHLPIVINLLLRIYRCFWNILFSELERSIPIRGKVEGDRNDICRFHLYHDILHFNRLSNRDDPQQQQIQQE